MVHNYSPLNSNTSVGFNKNSGKINDSATGFTTMKTSWFLMILMLLLMITGQRTWSQTTVIDPTVAGSFEGASFAADGWIQVQGTASANNNLALGVAATIGFTPTHGTKGVFVTTNGTSRGFNNTAASFAWIYKDVTLAAGQTKVTFTMDLFGNPGDLGYDGIVVGISDQTYTAPLVRVSGATSATSISGLTIATTATSNGFIEDGNYATATTRTFTIPVSALGNGVTSSSRRIWIGWSCDSSGGASAAPMSFDRVSLTTDVPANYVSTGSGDWSVAGTWNPAGVPSALDNVTIADGHTVTINTTATAACNNLTVGEGLSGTLIFNATVARTITVGGTLTIASGGTFQTAATGTVTTHSLSIAGNITNNGTLDFSTNGNTAGGSIAFTGAANQLVSGTGGTTDLYTLTMSKSALANLVDFNVSNFSVRGLSAAAVGSLLTSAVGTGTLKFSGTNTFGGTLWPSASSFTIPSTLGLWLNNPNFTVTGSTGGVTMSGLLRLTSGVFTAGTAAGNVMSGAGTFIIEGGTLNIASALNTSSALSFTMSSGTINVTTVGNATASVPGFGLTSTSATVNISGGTINLVQANSNATTPTDYQLLATSPTITGGTLNIGTAATAAGTSNFRIAGAVPTMIIDNTTTNKTATLSAATNAFGNSTITSGATLNLNGFVFTERASTFTNDGVLTGSVTGSRFYFGSPTNSAQTFAGSGTVTSALDGFGINTTGGLTITHANSIPTLRVNLFTGTITNSNKFTLGTGAALPVNIQVSQASNTTIPGGFFDQAPTLNLGTGAYNVSYQQESVARTTGFEIPSSRLVGSVTVNNTNGVILSGGDLTAATALTFTTGLLNTGSNTFILGTAAATPGTLTYTAGGFTYGSSFQRWVGNAAITVGNSAGQFPFSNTAGTQFRHAYFGSATAITGGFVKVQYNDVAGVTPVSISDIYGVGSRSNSNWIVSSGGGLTITNSDAQMRFRGDGIFTLSTTNNFLAVAASGVANGTSVLGTGTITAPEANKTLLNATTLAQTIYVGTANTITSTTTGGPWDVSSSWVGNTVPGCNDNVVIATGATITVNAANANSNTLTINTGAALAVSGSTLTVGCSANNNQLLNNGTLTVSGGTLAVNGNINNAAASIFSQTNGQIIIDGNSGVTSTSVLTSTPIFWLQNTIAANVTLSGGTLTIVDPHFGTSTTDDVFRYSGGAIITAGTGHTLQLGNGVSTQVGGNTTNGFSIAANSSGRVVLGNVVVNASIGTARFVANRLTGDLIGGNLTITAGDFRILSGLTTTIAGNISNAGTLTTIGTLQLAGVSSGAIVANTANQTIDGAGTFQNLAAASTANFANLNINNSNANATGVTFNTLNSLLCTTGVTNTGTVSGTFTITAGKINTGANIFYLGIGTGSTGTLAYTSGGFAGGSTFARWFAAAGGGTTIATNSVPSATGTGTYPFIAPNGVESRFFYLQRTNTTSATGGTIRVQYTDASGINTLSPTLNDVTPAYVVDRQTATKWTVSVGNGFATGSANTFTYAVAGANLFNVATSVARVVKPTSATTATLAGTFLAGTTLPIGMATGVTVANYAGDFGLGFGNADSAFTSVASSDWNLGSTWNKGTVPTASDNIFIGNGTNVTVSDTRTISNATVNPGGTLTVSGAGALTTTTTLVNGGTVTVSGGTITTTTSLTNNASAVINVTSGTLTTTTTLTNTGTFNANGGTTNVTGASATGITNTSTGVFNVAGGTVNLGTAVTGCNRTFANSGTLSVSSGTLNIFGNLAVASGSTFNQSGGDIVVDGNGAGVTGNSVASGTVLVNIASSLGTVTGGTLTIVDPNASGSARALEMNYSSGTLQWGTGHTLSFGNGISTDASTNTSGFQFDTYVGSSGTQSMIGNLVVAGGNGTNRWATTTSASGNGSFVKGNVTINSGSELRDVSGGGVLLLSGNLINNGTLSMTSAAIRLSAFIGSTEVPSANAQTIGGSGTFRNSTTASTASLASLSINNNNATGVTLNVPLSISGTLTMTSGLINTTSTNLLTLGTATAAGTLSGTGSATNMFVGPFARTFATRTASGTYDNTTLFPVGKAGVYTPINIDPTTTGVVVFKGEAFNSTSGSTFSGGATSLSTNRFEALPITGAANLTTAFIRLSDASIVATSKILQSPTAVGDYSPLTSPVAYAAGTPNNTLTTTSALLAAGYTGYLAYGGVNNCVAPTAQPTIFVVSSKGTTSFTGSFTAATGSPTGYLVVRYPSGGTVTPPADFTTYTAGALLGAGTVAYSGTALTFNATSLTANTTYDYYVYSYNNSGCSGPAYYIASPLQQSVTTCTANPGTPGTPTASNLSDSGVTATWTASSTSGVSYYIDVATNSGFTSLVPGYNNLSVGAVLTKNITGLSASTPYWIRVRADLGGCTSASSGNLTITTLCLSVTSINEGFESTTGGNFPSCWSKVGASGSANTQDSNGISGARNLYMYNSAASNAGRPVVALPPVSNASAGTHQLSLKVRANSVTGETLEAGYLTVPNDNSTFVSLGSLVTNSTSVAQTLLISPLTTPPGVTTLALRTGTVGWSVLIDDVVYGPVPTCYVPTGLTVSNLATTSATINWTAPVSGTTPGQYIYEVRTSGAAGSGASGLIALASGTTTGAPLFVNVSGLASQTTYSFYIKSDCGSGDFSSWSPALTFVTPCTATTIPYTEDFESVTTPAMPACTSIENLGTGNSWITESPAGNGFLSKTLTYIYNTSNAANVWFYTRGLTLTAGTNYIISYRYGCNSATTYFEKLKVAYGTAPTVVSMTNAVADYTAIQGNAAANLESIVFTPPSNGVYYFGFNAYSAANQNRLFVDDISVTLAPTCFVPTNIAASTILDTTAKITWTAPGTGTPTQYIYEVRTSGAAGSGPTGLVAAASGTTTGAPLFVDISNLTASTAYSFYIKSDCGSGDTSAWSTALNFTTACAAVALPVTELFNSSTIPNCWSQEFVSGALSFTFPTSGSSPSVSPQEGTNMVYYNSYSNSTQTRLVSANLSSIALPSVDVEFYWYHSTDGGSTSYLTEGITPQYSIDGGATWISVGSQILRYNAVAGWVKYTVTLPAAAANKPSLKVGFLFRGNGGYNSYLDNVTIKVGPSCGAPKNVIVNNLTTTTAKINWTAADIGTLTQYVYEVRTSGAAGSGPGGLVSAASGTTTGTPIFVNVSGLSANTTYTAYVRTDCGSGDFSAWSPAVTFTTPCNAVSSLNESFDSVTTPALPSCWSAILRGATIGSATIVSNATTTYSNSSPNAVRLYNAGAATATTDDVILVSPYLSNVGATTHRLRFNASYSASAKVQVGTLNSNDATATFTLLQSINLTSTNTEYIVDFSTYTGTDKYIGFRMNNSNGSFTYVYLDDIVWETIPTCYSPTGVAINNLNPVAGTANLAWTAPTLGATQSYQYILTGSSTAPVDGTGAATTTATTVTGYSGLVQGQTYYLWVRTFCGGTDYSAWVKSAVKIVPVVVPTPWLEPLATGTTPAGFTLTDVDIANYVEIGGNPGNSLVSYMYPDYYYYSGVETTKIVTSNLGLITATQIFSFDYKYAGTTTPYNPPSSGTANYKVDISTDYGATYTTLETVVSDNVTGWRSKSYPLAAYAGQVVTIRITTNLLSSFNEILMAFDNLSIQSPCTGNPNQGTITLASQSVCSVFAPTPLTVTGYSNDIGVAFQWEQSTTNSNPWIDAVGGSGATTTTYSPPIYAGTPIYYRMRSTCTTDNSVVYTTNTSSIDGNVKAVPFTEPFNVINSVAGWSFSPGWAYGPVRGATGNTAGNLVINLYSDSSGTVNTGTVTSAKYGPIVAGQAVYVDYNLSNYGTPYAPPTAGSGKFEVFISNDCGVNFTSMGLVNNDGVAGYRTLIYPIPASYYGQNVVIRVVATRTSGDYDLSIDNMGIQTPPPTITAFSPTGICAGTAGTIVLDGTYLNGVTSVTMGNDVSVPFTYNSLTGQITITLAAGNTITSGQISVYNAAGGRGNSSSFTIKPFPPAFQITGTQTICSDSTTQLGTDIATSGTAWTTSASGVATVDVNGLVTGQSAGTSTIGFSVTTDGCTTYNTTPFVVTVQQKIVITQQPANTTATVGSTRKFKVLATGLGSLTYQWYYLDEEENGPFTVSNGTVSGVTFAGATANELTVSNIPASYQDYQFYCIIGTDTTCSDVTSSSAFISISPVGIDENPVSLSQCGLTAADFTVEASPIGLILGYQWTKLGVSGYEDISDTGIYAGTTTATLTVAPTAALNETYKVKVFYSPASPANFIESNAATFSAETAPTVTGITGNVTVCRVSGTPQFTITTGGGPGTIQWQSSPNPTGGPWTNVSGGTGLILSVPVTASSTVGTTYYQAVVTGNGACASNPAISATRSLIISQPTVSISSQSAAFYCTPGGTAVNLSATGTAPSYTWTSSITPSGLPGNLSSASGANVSVTPSSTAMYTVTATDANGCTNTAEATVSVGNRFTTTVTPSLTSTCPGTAVALTSSVVLADPTNTRNISNYDFVNTTSPYATIVGETDTTALSLLTTSSTASADDGISNAITLPFNFTFGGNSFTNFKVSTNGWISFDPLVTNVTASTTLYTPLSGSFNNIISAFSKDLISNNTASTTYYMQTSGTSPNRVVKVEWAGIKGYQSASPLTGNMQIWLYEGSNIVEIHYGSFTQQTASSNAAQVGLRGATNGTADVFAFSSGPWSAPTVSNTNSASIDLGTSGSPILPDDGRVYKFTPKTAPVNNTYTYLWSSTPAGLVSGSTSANVSPTVTTDYKLVVTAQTGCSSEDTKTVTVKQRPVAAVTGASVAICNGGTATISGTITATGAYSLTLSNGGGVVTGTGSGTWSTSVSPTANTTYTITALSDANACPSIAADLTGSQVITVKARPVAAVTGSGVSICNGASATVSGTITATGAWSLVLTNGGGTVTGTGSGTWSTSVSPSTTTTYAIASLSDANACPSIAADLTGSKVVTVKARPVAAVTGASTGICAGGSATISGTVTAIGAWSLTLSNGTVVNGSGATWSTNVSPSATTTYTITALSDTNLCPSIAEDLSGSQTITVNPINGITLTSATNTDNQQAYIDTAIVPITYSTTAATGATVTGLPSGVTGSWSANQVTINGVPDTNVGSPFHYTVTLTGAGTCGVTTATGTITVNNQSNWYLDVDGDHYYTGAVQVQGPSPGEGWTNTGIIAGGDCNDTVAGLNGVPGNLINPGRPEICWNNVNDNCNATLPILSEGCTPVVVNMTPSYNGTTLPSLSTSVSAVPYSYLTVTNLKYRFSITNITTGATAPDIIQTSRFVTIPASIHLYGASYTIKASAVINDEVVPFAGNTILVHAPTVQLITLSSASCGATLASLTSTIAANAGLNATGYTFRIRLNDGSTTEAAGPFAYSQSGTRYVSANSFAGFPLQYSKSYKVSVQYTFNDPVTTLPVQSGYGSECTINTPAIPVTTIASPTEGFQVAGLNSGVTATSASYATAYQFRIRLKSDNGLNPSYRYTAEVPSRFSSLTAFGTPSLAYNTEYVISVRYSVAAPGGPAWSEYGPDRTFKTPFFPVTNVTPSQCGASGPTSLTQQLNIVPYPGYPHYKVLLEEVNGEVVLDSQEIEVAYSYFRLNQFSIAQIGKTYSVSVAIILNGTQGPYETSCDVNTIPGKTTAMAVPFKATAYPNPFANNFMLDVKTTSQSSVNVKVYDMVGRLIEQRDVRVSDMETATIGDRYPSGVYNVVVSQEENVQTVRVVKR